MSWKSTSHRVLTHESLIPGRMYKQKRFHTYNSKQYWLQGTGTNDKDRHIARYATQGNAHEPVHDPLWQTQCVETRGCSRQLVKAACDPCNCEPPRCSIEPTDAAINQHMVLESAISVRIKHTIEALRCNDNTTKQHQPKSGQCVRARMPNDSIKNTDSISETPPAQNTI